MDFVLELIGELAGEVLDALFGEKVTAWTARQKAKIRTPLGMWLWKALPIAVYALLAAVAILCLVRG